jgi:Ubiquinol cytochrome reductase transmembrane region
MPQPPPACRRRCMLPKTRPTSSSAPGPHAAPEVAMLLALILPVADSATVLCCMRSYDEHAHERFPTGDPSKRAFTYFVLTGGRFIYASALRLAVLKFILSMTVSFIATVGSPIYFAGPCGCF